MTYVVVDACIKCKYTDCVEICPVDCFFEGENMLVIDPDTCIDCGLCVPECPIDAIKPDTDPQMESWVALNRRYAKQWPQILQKKAPPGDADLWKDVPDKMTHFSAQPSSGASPVGSPPNGSASPPLTVTPIPDPRARRSGALQRT